jgi:hypothetical protein
MAMSLIAAHFGADMGDLSAWIALAVQQVAGQTGKDAHLTKDVEVEIVGRAPAAPAHAFPALSGGRGAGYEADTTDDGGRDSGLVELAHFSSLE